MIGQITHVTLTHRLPLGKGAKGKIPLNLVQIVVVADRFYTALFSTLEQTHCALDFYAAF